MLRRCARPAPLVISLLLSVSLATGCHSLASRSAPAPPARASASPPTTPSPATTLHGRGIPADVTAVLEQLRRKHAAVADGEVYASGAPHVDPRWFGIAIATVQGDVHGVGDIARAFPIQSTAKPFTYALALDDHGPAVMLERVGVNATGLPYNSVIASAVRPRELQNPMVSAGAIATMATIRGSSERDRWTRVRRHFERFAGRSLPLSREIYDYEMDHRIGSQALASVLSVQNLLWMPCTKGSAPSCFTAPSRTQIDEIVGRYLRSTSQEVTAERLAIMGATLANGGINPLTGVRALRAEHVPYVLSAMVTAGMYDASGEWLSRVGLPAKSGVSGNIVAVVPGRFAIAVYSPPLDASGNSVRAQMVIEDLSRQWGLHTFGTRSANRPATPSAPLDSPASPPSPR